MNRTGVPPTTSFSPGGKRVVVKPLSFSTPAVITAAATAAASPSRTRKPLPFADEQHVFISPELGTFLQPHPPWPTLPAS